jgi:RNA polymerase sigma-70 factor (ECF subfamily)
MDARLQQAVAGDQDALGQLLFEFHDRLAAFVGAGLPARLQGVVDVEDVLQQTYIDAFRGVRAFTPEADGSFYRWLETIAEHRLLDAIRAHDCLKRGGNRRVEHVMDDGQSVHDLFDVLAASLPTASQFAARHEAVAALTAHIDDLPAGQRDAIRLFHLDGHDCEEVARRLGRSSDEIRGLLYRGRRKLRDAMGNSSLYLTKK